MATDSDYLKRLSDIDELKRYIRHLENRLTTAGLYFNERGRNYFRVAYLGESLAKEIDRD